MNFLKSFGTYANSSLEAIFDKVTLISRLIKGGLKELVDEEVLTLIDQDTNKEKIG